MPYQDQRSIAFPGEVQKRIMQVAREYDLPAYRLLDEAVKTWLAVKRSGLRLNGDAEPQE